jgi:hypothetical protein
VLSPRQSLCCLTWYLCEVVPTGGLTRLDSRDSAGRERFAVGSHESRQWDSAVCVYLPTGDTEFSLLYACSVRSDILGAQPEQCKVLPGRGTERVDNRVTLDCIALANSSDDSDDG